ncbi:TonB-dependent receptor [Natronoflexus pectinivorans]|uniref:TonB-dependent receptor-like protein n=1 Tax=Natronoflexus pectinivorans TaxID=682526 RepID=A0A4R2GIH5_9BACT|nr:TonB-dependent receptor [Natronoflexus pectinivorans]TCO08010.1 TonB-dependent receptor-like protein [Natronoflexus pectinivorans]
MLKFRFIIILLANMLYINAQHDARHPVISGYVKDVLTGEVLPGATILIKGISTGTSTNAYGYFSLSVPAGNHNIQIAFVGYESLEKEIDITRDMRIYPALTPLTEQIGEIEILSSTRDDLRRNPIMGTETLDALTINSTPVLFGESDPLKTLQLLPGISATSEGSTSLSVRGGDPDQNLILLDEATVYNAGHLLGFFSIFNNDAIKEVTTYKGDLPAYAGGRIASLVDVRSRDGNMNQMAGIAGIGIISSRLMLEGPVIENRASFLTSARRTYLDMFLPLANDEEIKDNSLYFYDLNLKLNYIADDNNRIFLSTYIGRDVFSNDLARMNFGNKAASLRWSRVFNPRLFGNLSLITSSYDYFLGSSGDEFQRITWKSKLNDYSLKYDFTYYASSESQWSFGIQSTFRKIKPAIITSPNEEAFITELRVPDSNSLENALYISHSHQIGDLISLRYGLRYSLFQNIGSGQTFTLNDEFTVLDTLKHTGGKIFNSYSGLEPRLGISYLISPNITLKGSYTNSRQYLHLATNSSSSTPLDVWFTSSPNIKPQIGHQFSSGLFYSNLSGIWNHSLEVYIKQNKNAIDFKDHPDLLVNEALEAEVRPGKARSRGIEWMSRYSGTQVSGWLSYTFSRAERHSQWINNGNWYLSPYDRTHDFSIVLMYNLNERLNISGNWVYFTGAPVTMPVGRYSFQSGVVPIYSDRNSERMPDYHRMDISVTLRNRKQPDRRWQSEWNFSVYNLYGRKNAWLINFTGDEYVKPGYRYAEMTYLFSIIPSITYTVKF